MTNEQFNSTLELLAKLIEKTASSAAEAAAIVREAKIAVTTEETRSQSLDFDADELAVPEIRVGRRKK